MIMQCGNEGCSREALEGKQYCRPCERSRYTWMRRNMKKVMGVPNAKGIARGGRM